MSASPSTARRTTLPPPWSRTGRALAVWVLGTLPPTYVVLGHGPGPERGGKLLALAMAGAVAALAARRATVAIRATIAAPLVVLAGVWAVPAIGRAPFIVAAISTAVAFVALFGSPAHDGTPPAWRSLALGVQAIAGTVWVVTAPADAWAPVEVLAVAALAAHRFRAVQRFDRTVETVITDAVRRFLDRVILLGLWVRPRLLALRTQVPAAGRRVARRVRANVLRAVERAHAWITGHEYPRVVFAGLVTAAIVAPMYPRMVPVPKVLVRGTNDIPGTIERIHVFSIWPLNLPVPHPGWTVLMKMAIPIFGVTASVAIILAAATAAATMVLVTIGRGHWDDRPRLSWPLAYVLGIGWVVFENPGLLLPPNGEWWGRVTFAGERARGTSFAAIHQWGTPTITLSMGFAFSLFALILLVISSTRKGSERTPKLVRWLALLTFTSTMVQPASTLVLVPGTVLYLLVTRTLSKPLVRNLGLSLVLPGVSVIAWQVWFLTSEASPYEQSSWLWRPFWAFPYFGVTRIAFFLTGFIYVLCAWAGGRRWLQDPSVRLALCGVIVSLPTFLLLEQTIVTGVPDGDLGVMPLMASIFLFLASLRFLLIEAQTVRASAPAGSPLRRPPWLIATTLFLSLMLVAGIVDLLGAAGVIAET